MVRLSTTRQDIILHIMESIVKCEGGSVETITEEGGDVMIKLHPSIPLKLWCKDCKKRLICKSKLIARWSKTT